MRYVATVLLILLVLSIAIGFITLSATVPTKEDFLDWYRERVLFDNTGGIVVEGIKKFAIDDYMRLIENCTMVERHLTYSVFIVKNSDSEEKYSGMLRDITPIK